MHHMDLVNQIDWGKVREWLSPLISFLALVVSVVSVRRAIRESRAKAAEAAARAADAKKYTETLETIIQYGKFVQHLEGVDKRVGSVADQLAGIAERTREVIELADRQIGESVKSLATAAEAATEISQQLAEISRTALRAQGLNPCAQGLSEADCT
jgi:methyl-accepting chemotaxis protein